MSIHKEKADTFLGAIYKSAEEQKRRIEAEIEEHKRAEIQRMEAEMREQIQRTVSLKTMQVRQEMAGERTQREQENRRRLFERRQALTKQVFEKAAGRLLEASNGPAYQEKLLSMLKAVAGAFVAEDTILVLRPQDIAYEDECKALFPAGVEIQTDASIRLGGFRLSSGLLRKQVDQTLDSALEAQRPWFEETSGLQMTAEG